MGITFAFLRVDIVPAVALIGATTFVLASRAWPWATASARASRSPATFAGGVVLILIGTKILLEHLGVIAL